MDKPLPKLSEINRPLYKGALEGKLRLQLCRSCGKRVYYPRVVCPYCFEDDLEWTNVSGQGAVYSFALVHRPQHPAFNAEGPIVLAAVALAEGPVMLREVVECDPTEVYIGMPVEPVWEHRSEEISVARFRPLREREDMKRVKEER